MAASDYIRFDDAGRIGKTRRWFVVAKEREEILGQIRWYGAWRGYSFFPVPETVFEKKCLAVIAGFLAERTAERRATWRRSR